MGDSSRPAVTLRDVSEEDLPVFFDHQKDPEATRMADFPARKWAAHLEHWRRVLADDTVVTRTIVCDGEVAGNIVSWEHDGERDVGYWIGRSHWGQGVATAALSQFLVLLPTRPIHAHVARGNVASLRVLEKCGFRLLSGDAEELVLVLPRQA